MLFLFIIIELILKWISMQSITQLEQNPWKLGKCLDPTDYCFILIVNRLIWKKKKKKKKKRLNRNNIPVHLNFFFAYFCVIQFIRMTVQSRSLFWFVFVLLLDLWFRNSYFLFLIKFNWFLVRWTLNFQKKKSRNYCNVVLVNKLHKSMIHLELIEISCFQWQPGQLDTICSSQWLFSDRSTRYTYNLLLYWTL